MNSIIPQRILRHENAIIPWMLGIGLICFGLHSEWLLWTINGSVVFFPPWIGIICILAAINWAVRTDRLKYDWRPLWITIPILTIAISLLARISIERSTESLAELGFVLSFIMIYFIARHYGKVILYPIVAFAIIEALSVILYVLFVGSWHTEDMTTGGLVSTTNYDVAVGVMAIGLGCGLFIIKSQRNLILYGTLLITVMFLTGSPETLVVIGILSVWLLIAHRRSSIDMIKRNSTLIKSIIAALIVAGVSWTAFGGMDGTTSRITHIMSNTADAGGVESIDEYPDYGDGRFPAYKRALTTIQIFGHGYDLHHYQVDHNGAPVEKFNDPTTAGVIAHNVPLVILEQIGPLGALAWLVVSIYCFIVSTARMRVLWVIVGALCIFDHFIWTTIAPFWWLIVGLTIWEVNHEISQRDMAGNHFLRRCASIGG